jgi:hypothetical protein
MAFNKDKKEVSSALGAGIVGAGAASVLTYLLTRRASATPPPEGNVIFTPDEDTWNLLMGILDGIVAGNDKLEYIKAELNSILTALGGSVENPKRTISETRLLINAGVGFNLPSYEIPYDKVIIIKALNDPAYHVNVGTIMVGDSKVSSENMTTAYPLLPGETVGYKVRNSNSLWVCPVVAGDGVSWTVEQE